MSSKPVLSLKQFMLRQDVLKLYRTIVRTTYKIPDKQDRATMLDMARHQFKVHKNETDDMEIRVMLKRGETQLQQFRSAMQLAGSS